MSPQVTIPKKTYRSRLQQTFATLTLALVALIAVALGRSRTSAASLEDQFAIGLTGARWSWAWWTLAVVAATLALASVRLWRMGVVIDDCGITVHDHRGPWRLPWAVIDRFQGGESFRRLGLTFHQAPVAVLVGGEQVDLDFGLRLWHLLDPVGFGLVARVQPAPHRRIELLPGRRPLPTGRGGQLGGNVGGAGAWAQGRGRSASRLWRLARYSGLGSATPAWAPRRVAEQRPGSANRIAHVVAVQHVGQYGDDVQGFLVRQQHARPRAWLLRHPITHFLSVPAARPLEFCERAGSAEFRPAATWQVDPSAHGVGRECATNGALVLHRVGIYGRGEKEQDAPIVLDGAVHAWEHAGLPLSDRWELDPYGASPSAQPA